MNVELFKEAAYLAGSVQHFYQTRTSWDDENGTVTMESPDIPGCRVTLLDDDSDDLHERLDRAHYEKRLEVFYNLLLEGKPLPPFYKAPSASAEAVARAKEQSPHYFIVKAEWKAEDGDAWNESGWLVTSELPLRNGRTQHVFDFEPDLGRALMMIGDNFWCLLDLFMEDDEWPPERADVVVTHQDGSTTSFKVHYGDGA